jgi:glycosyltransferase involved in cell wall biosynthesis
MVIVTRSDIVPTDHGAAVKIDRTAWGLSHLFDAVYLVSGNRERYFVYRAGARTEHSYPRWLALLGPEQARVDKRLNDLGLPASDAFLFEPLIDWSFVARTLYLGRRSGARLFQAEFPAYARACIWAQACLGGRTLLVEHNVEYERLRSQFPDMSEHTFKLLQDTEVQLCNRVDAVVAVSQRDRNRLLADGVSAEKIHVIPHGVDLEVYDEALPANVRDRFDIDDDSVLLVYHGIYLYPPNLEAMQLMASQVLPRLQRQGVNAKVLAIGRHPPAKALHPDILFTGSVERLAPYLLAADIAVVPLMRGGGTRMKILDYFAAGLPVVSTTKGIEGMSATPTENVLIFDDWDDFATAIQSLASDRASAAAIGAAGRRFVAGLGWRDITRRYLDLV